MKRDIILFLAGAEAFHTFAHIFMGFAFRFPIHSKIGAFPHSLNTAAIIVNGLITIGLLLWAKKLSKHK